MSYVEIKITKGLLCLTECELLNGLPPSLVVLGLRRGKIIKRGREMQKRDKQQLTGNLTRVDYGETEN